LTYSSLPAAIVGKTAFGDPMSYLVAVIPYVLPLIFVGTLFILYQRYLPREDMRRNLFVLTGLVCFAVSFFMIVYAGLGSGWWTSVPFGSWSAFAAGLQVITDALLGSVGVIVLYIAIVSALFGFFAYNIISPPNPDFVRLNDELKAANDGAKDMKSQVQSLEGENKRLKEFVSEKEGKLSSLETQVSALKSQIGERTGSFAEMEAKLKAATDETDAVAAKEEELLATIAQKDQRIGAMQSELASLKSRPESAPKAAPASTGDAATLKAVETKLKSAEAKLESMNRRAETATEVADSVISDLAHLISQVESSKLDPQAKKVVATLIESLGKAVNRVSRPPGEKAPDEPRVEMIGAVMMIHEIVDTIKKMSRGI
jgi:predicted  nucleic acid-binding Zn-ribbon protein